MEKSLSIKEGRLVLFQSTLASLRVYMVSSCIVPATIIHEIEKLMMLFLWGAMNWTRAGTGHMPIILPDGAEILSLVKRPYF